LHGYKKYYSLMYVKFILRLFTVQSIRGVQFEITAIQIFRERLSLKNVERNFERKLYSLK